MIVANIRRLIEQDKKKNGPGRKIDTPTTYQELLAISIKGGGNKPDDVVEISHDEGSKNSKQVSNSQIDRSKVAAASKDAAAAAAAATPAAPAKKPKKKTAQENKLNAIALLVLFLPPLLYYAVDR